MPAMKTIPTILSSLLVCLLMAPASVIAEQRYVVDTIVVSLREGPGTQYKAIKTVQTGQALEVLDAKNNFIQVRTAEGDEGWLPNQFASSQPTGGSVAQELQAKIQSLTAQNEKLAAQLTGKAPQSPNGENEFSGLKKLQTKLDAMTEQYHVLEAEAKKVTEAQEENQRLKNELTAIQSSMTQLKEDNKTLVQRREIYWFLAGGAVFLLGWITGKISFRRQRHSLSL